MDLQSTPSPAHVLRRRKKRSTPTNNNAPGSSLSGLNRSSRGGHMYKIVTNMEHDPWQKIRVVEILRGTMGYGFTISGQKPCLLRCIVEGSPAQRAYLRPGNCLVGVNGQDVSSLAHDDVVRLIGNCTGLLRLHVADSYFSESSDDETFQVHQPRPKYPHRPRALAKKIPVNNSKLPGADCSSNTNEKQCLIKKPGTTPGRSSGEHHRGSPTTSTRRASWDPLLPTPRRIPRPPLPFNNTGQPPISINTPIEGSSHTHNENTNNNNPRVDIVRVFAHLDNHSGMNNNDGGSSSNSAVNNTVNGDVVSNVGAIPYPPVIMNSNAVASSTDRFNTQSSSASSSARTHNNLVGLRKGNHPTVRSNISLGTAIDCPDQSSIYLVGYIGSVELPEIEEKKRLQALSACVRRLRLEKRVRSIVLLRIQSNGVSLFSQNVQHGPPLAFYSSNIIAFCGAYSDDRRFFGLVTCTGHGKNCSCHVFMVEPKLLSHSEHVRRARAFGIVCTSLPMPKNGQVLGLQECAEFPATADPILSSILRMEDSTTTATPQLRSPSEASNRLESTNSSNSDSGIGFRDDSDRTSARIYDIVEPELSLVQDLRHFRHSPAPPRKRFPISHRKNSSSQSSPQPCTSSSCSLPSTSKRCHVNPVVNGQPTRTMRDNSSSRVSNPSCFFSDVVRDDQVGFHMFESDPNSLREILGINDESNGAGPCLDINMKRRSVKNLSRDRLCVTPRPTCSRQPHHIEVSVLVTPPRALREKRVSMEQMTPISPSTASANIPLACSPQPHHAAGLTRNGTKSQSLDNLCSPEILVQNSFESKGNIGSSTPALNHPALNQELGKGDNFGDDFFKVPQPPPKPKMEVNRVEKWAECIEKLLGDKCGLEIFTEFLQHEFSAENIHFYTACQNFKENFPDLEESERASLALNIFLRFLQNGATDPVNVDFQARCQVEKALSQPSIEMFDLPLAQVFNLLKFDCYPRFLRCDMFRDFAAGVTSLPLPGGDPSDSDQDSVKSHKLHHDGRRRSLLPWNIKNRSKNKNRNKNEVDGLNSDLSFIQRTAMIQNNFDGSDQDDNFRRRQSYKLCRVILPDNSTTVLPCKPSETLCTTVQRLLEKRELHYSAFEVVSVATGKPLDLSVEVSEMTSREIKVEPRAFLGIELPLGWRVGVRANPNRKISEVLKPILTQHSLKLDSVLVFDIETEQLVDVKWPMLRVDGHNVNVKLKADPRLEEITNQIREFGSYDHEYLDDDQTSTKTSSSQTSSSVFRGFLRRSSKKYKRKGKNVSHHSAGGDNNMLSNNNKDSLLTNEAATTSGHTSQSSSQSQMEDISLSATTSKIISDTDEENLVPRQRQVQSSTPGGPSVPESPLSGLNLAESSRNRKAIVYITQSAETTKS